MSKVFRFQNGLEVLDLRDELPRQRDAAGNLVKVPLRDMTALEGIAIHHSGAPVHKDFSALELATYHVFDRRDENGQPDPWPVIAYDWLAHWDGRKEYCKPWEMVGYHVGGLNNYRWLAICAPGWWADGREPPQAQIAAVSDLIDAINFAFGRQFPIKPHSALSATSCPGIFYDRLMAYRAAKAKPAPAPASEADLLRAELAKAKAEHKARLQAIEAKATETVALARVP